MLPRLIPSRSRPRPNNLRSLWTEKARHIKYFCSKTGNTVENQHSVKPQYNCIQWQKYLNWSNNEMELSPAVLNWYCLKTSCYISLHSSVVAVGEGSQCQVLRLIQPRNLSIRHCKTETWKKSNNDAGPCLINEVFLSVTKLLKGQLKRRDKLTSITRF